MAARSAVASQGEPAFNAHPRSRLKPGLAPERLSDHHLINALVATRRQWTPKKRKRLTPRMLVRVPALLSELEEQVRVRGITEDQIAQCGMATRDGLLEPRKKKPTKPAIKPPADLMEQLEKSIEIAMERKP